MSQDLSPSSLLQGIAKLLATSYRDPVWLQATLAAAKTHPSNYANWQVADEQNRLDVSLTPAMNRTVAAELSRAGVTLKEGLALRILVKPGISRFGKLHVELLGIDAQHSQRQSALTPQEVFQDLVERKLAHLQRDLALSEFPFNIALVGAPGSDGVTDALAVLESSGIAFRVATFDTPVQGSHAPLRIKEALSAVLALRSAPDAVVLVRGGGARADLAAFDDPGLAEFLCAYPIPVLTGIGHEADTTVCDLVAHHTERTPTGLATWLRDRIQDRFSSREAATVSAISSVKERLQLASAAIDRRAAVLATTAEHLDARAHALELSLQLITDLAQQRCAASSASLEAAYQRVCAHADACIALAISHLDVSAAKVSELHPQRALERGFAIVQQPDGSLLRSVPAPDSQLLIQVAEGSFSATSK
jgi:exodeoxyribonuclease VII large subunit